LPARRGTWFGGRHSPTAAAAAGARRLPVHQAKRHQDQRTAGQLSQTRALAEQHERGEHPEDRDEVQRDRGSRRRDRAHREVVEQEGNGRAHHSGAEAGREVSVQDSYDDAMRIADEVLELIGRISTPR